MSNVNNFAMKSENSTAQIKCTSDSQIHFSRLQHIHIANLEFIGCGGNQVKYVKRFAVKNTIFRGQETSGTALELIETTAQIVNSTFVSNRQGSYQKCAIYCYFGGVFIGGAIITTSSIVDINQSKFEDNGTDLGGAIFADKSSIINMSGNVFANNSAVEVGGALTSHNSNITIEASEFYDNSAIRWGGVVSSDSSTITIETSNFHDNSATREGGVLLSVSSTIVIKASEFYDNIANNQGGVLYSSSCTIMIQHGEFHDNSASWGGTLFSYSSSTIRVEASQFHNNIAAKEGGVLSSDSSTVAIEASEFHNNSTNWGGVLYSSSSNITMEASKFYDNSATTSGGVLSVFSGSTVTIEASRFGNSSANRNGVLSSQSSNITIEASNFHDNCAISGGVLAFFGSTISAGGCNFTKNVSPIGAVIYAARSSKVQYHNYVLIDNNLATDYAVLYLAGSEFIGCDSGNIIKFSNNMGSLVAFNSNITLVGLARFMNNQPPQTASGGHSFQEGGAITLSQSNAFLHGISDLQHNHAENGGAIYSTESKLYVNGNVTIAHNTATINGGGIYLSNSELNCHKYSTLDVFNNAAVHKGGGLYAISSSIKAISTFVYNYNTAERYFGTRIIFTRNAAEKGGGLALEANAKFYILKYDILLIWNALDANTTAFTANMADYGGAVYVEDDTNCGTCNSDTVTECFLQVLALHDQESLYLKTQSIHFSQNNANISGSTLYGGLLDRCVVSQFAEFYKKYTHDYKVRGDGIAYFKSVSIPIDYSYAELTKEVSINTISSLPVRVYLCISNESDCNYERHVNIEIKKGQMFTLSVVAVDQISQQEVTATIQTSLHFTESGLAEGQLARKIPANSSDLTFNVVSPQMSELLTL